MYGCHYKNESVKQLPRVSNTKYKTLNYNFSAS